MVFFEAPHRTEAVLTAMAEAFGADRTGAVCRELTKTHEEVRRGPLGDLVEWAGDGVRGEVTIVVAGAAPAAEIAADPDSLRAAVAAQFEGVFEKYVEAAFHHMWVDPKKMDDPEIAAKALASSGLDAAKLLARSQDADVKAKLIENTQNAVERGAFGSPTFFVGSEIFFGKEQLREVEEMIAAK